ncbi:MG2 domain-containing protein [Fodinibius salinus]|uniref:MG2 domain-containing protein n=1 Tax=Fodinibius salinus TaxID=860790 RepID=UPI0014787B80|nr:MG2 domain-containing protein [Fodinibius salinus]
MNNTIGYQQTNTRRNLIIWGLLCLLLLAGGCGKSKKEVIEQNEAFSKYISGYTSNIISTRDEIVVRLASEFKKEERPQKELFQFELSVVGNQIWLDNRTVAFRPKTSLQNDTRYIVHFRTGALFDVNKSLEEFTFDFGTIRQDLEVQIEGVNPVDGNRSQQQLNGTIHTADVAALSNIKSVLEARQNGNSLPVEWEQKSGKQQHHFTIKDIKRTQQPGSVIVSWDGESIGTNTRGKQTVPISSLDAFQLVKTQVSRDTNPHIALTFSDALDPNQNFDGLIRIGSYDKMNTIVQENRLEIYPRKKLKGRQKLSLSPGIQSKHGKRLGEQVSRTVQLHQPKPKVRFVGQGVIVPNSEELLVPFKAVSLGAVDVQVSRIYENNIPQFLQTNNLNGSQYLERVGVPVVQKVVPLSSLGATDVSKWNNYALDLSNLIEPKPGAIYEVEIGFRKHQIVYPCGDDALTKLEDRNWTQSSREENKYWDRFGDYYYPDGYNWRERDNPCDVSFYTDDHYIRRNVLASDLGLIAKKGNVGATQVIVTDLNTAQPKSGVTLELYDYQQQKMTSMTSDGQGMAKAKTQRKPFLLVAKDGKQRGYLKLKDGNSLSLSDFDVSGAQVKEGIKGFMYGDRGVWRPGDSLYVTLIVEDKQDILPEDHPVTFELRNPSGQVMDQQTITDPVNNFYDYRTKTTADAPTGNWMVRAQLGNNTFSKTIKVETVKPNRLKVNLDPTNKRLTASDRILDGRISAQWLHGATAQNLKTDISMTLTSSPISFDDYDDFVFDDPSRSLDAATEKIFEG